MPNVKYDKFNIRDNKVISSIKLHLNIYVLIFHSLNKLLSDYEKNFNLWALSSCLFDTFRN